MRVVLALDKFKGTLTSQQANECLADGIRQRNPKIEVALRPMADGGDGSAAILASYMGLEVLRVEVTDLFGKVTEGHVYWQNSRRIAVIETAELLGTSRSVAHKSDALRATTAGLGQLLKKAFDLRPKEIWIAVGGTMTVDAGWGLAQVFGLKAQDSDGNDVSPTLLRARDISVITRSAIPDYMVKTKVIALCDVNASALGAGVRLADFLPQKGISSQEIPDIEQNLKTFWSHLHKSNPFIPALESPYTGAGGALCLGLAAIFPNFLMELGAARIARVAALAQSFQGADLAVCGEGCLDSQTLAGKASAIVSQIAQEHGVRVAGVFGRIAGDQNKLLNALGIKDSFSITSTQLMHSSTELAKLSKSRFHEIGIEIAHIVEAAAKKHTKN
ncbi:glycerate kinase [bacterium]|nr:glycerate kinase [bacterium]